MRGNQSFHVPAQVVPKMPPVGDLHSVGCAVSGTVGVAAGPVPADDLHTGMATEPVGEVGGVPAQEHVDRAVPVGQVDQHRAVLVAAWWPRRNANSSTPRTAPGPTGGSGSARSAR
jgi:hypothetical protein